MPGLKKKKDQDSFIGHGANTWFHEMKTNAEGKSLEVFGWFFKWEPNKLLKPSYPQILAYKTPLEERNQQRACASWPQ